MFLRVGVISSAGAGHAGYFFNQVLINNLIIVQVIVQVIELKKTLDLVLCN